MTSDILVNIVSGNWLPPIILDILGLKCVISKDALMIKSLLTFGIKISDTWGKINTNMI